MREQSARFEAINNRENIYRGNWIEDVSRGGIAVSFESNSQIVENRIDGVHNDCNLLDHRRRCEGNGEFGNERA
ncbi:MAG: hypothetical protein R3F28_03320 [Candidatus Kapaibacterium sp.]